MHVRARPYPFLRPHSRMQLLTARCIKARTVHERDLRARTNVYPRRFTINFGNRRLEKERTKERERKKTLETIYVERVRIDRVCLMATLVHDIIIDRGLSYCGKDVENCKWLSKL